VTADTADARLSSVGATVSAELVDVTKDIWERILRTIPELDTDELVVDVLRGSVEENVARLAHMFQRRLGRDAVAAPAAAIEYARRLAQRGISVNALVRAYRVGHSRFLHRCLDELARQEHDPKVFQATTGLMIEVSFEYIDKVSEQVITAYQNERDRWLLSQTAVRSGRVRALLEQPDTDVDRAETALGYRLRQRHVALVLWVSEQATDGASLVKLDRMVTVIGAELRCNGRPLFVPCDEFLAWAWLPFGVRGDIRLDRLADVVAATDPTARVAAGDPGSALTAFVGATSRPSARRPSRWPPSPATG